MVPGSHHPIIILKYIYLIHKRNRWARTSLIPRLMLYVVRILLAPITGRSHRKSEVWFLSVITKVSEQPVHLSSKHFLHLMHLVVRPIPPHFTYLANSIILKLNPCNISIVQLDCTTKNKGTHLNPYSHKINVSWCHILPVNFFNFPNYLHKWNFDTPVINFRFASKQRTTLS